MLCIKPEKSLRLIFTGLMTWCWCGEMVVCRVEMETFLGQGLDLFLGSILAIWVTSGNPSSKHFCDIQGIVMVLTVRQRSQ